MKHGPIALIDEQPAVVVLLPKDPMYEKTLSNLKGGGRGARRADHRAHRCAAITRARGSRLGGGVHPAVNHPLAPILLVIPLQLLAYSTRCTKRQRDVDQPRNLAKSVTVE